MPYDKTIAKRCENVLKGKKGLEPRKMFGGIGFLLRGNMCIGVWRDYLILRLGTDAAPAALKKKHVKAFDITGRAMRGWAMVHKDGLKTKTALETWINQAVEFVSTLPRK